MELLPIEITARIKRFIVWTPGSNPYHLLNPYILCRILQSNKIVFTDDPLFLPTFKPPIFGLLYNELVDNFKQFLEKKWKVNREVLCFYKICTSPMFYDVNFNPSKSLIVTGKFIKVDDDFILKDIINRSDQIDKILS